MSYDIRDVKNLDGLIRYFIDNLNWKIDLDDFDEIDDITYDFSASEIGLKEEAFAKITSLRQLQPISDYQKWGIFCVEFDSDKFVVSALRKILSGLIPKKRNATEHAVWQQKDLLFLCFWGKNNNRTIGIAHFEDKENGLPQIKMISCAPAIENFEHISYFEERLKYLSWVKDERDTDAWYKQWTSAFVSAYREVIRTSSALTIKLAEEAKKIRERILEFYNIETEKGYVHKLYNDFRDALIHDMTKEQFADMYAQTVVYGLFSARCMDETLEDFSAKEAVDCIPITNPFLKKLMKECLGEGTKRLLTFDELEVSNVVDILIHTNTELILKDFNRQTGGGKEDPVIHFYEEFLTAYNKELKIQRGVFYTPQPVVNFIVRAVDSILKTEFGLKDGLASEEQKEILVDIEGKKRRERKSMPAVQILDPATGTGTFIRQTILQIYANFREKHRGESEEQINSAWNQYVPKHLLPRLNAFELMMAPYAVAHMKLAMVLKDTGYDFSSDQRLKVFLTNSLEEAGNSDMQISLFDNDPLALESVEANQAKKNTGINIIIGNPPYSGESANKGEWIMSLMEDYKKEPGGRIKLQERNPKWINDDYVKFIRYAQTYINRSHNGILAYICPHGFLDNPTFRGMRWALLQEYNKIYVLNLHGNVKKKEVAPDGSKDENVFDIQQGVCIILAIKIIDNTNDAEIYYEDLYGLREQKYGFLSQNNLTDINFKKVFPSEPQFFFVPKDLSLQKEYNSFVSTTDLFPLTSVGIVTGRDNLNVSFKRELQINKMEQLSELDVEVARNTFNLGKDVRDWRVEWAKKDILQCIDSIDKHIIPYSYRPFDTRYTCFTGTTKGLYCYPRYDVMHNLINTNNIALVFKRGFDNETAPCFITSQISDFRYWSCPGMQGGDYVSPLYIFNSNYNSVACNINEIIARKLLKHTDLNYDEAVSKDLFAYVYAVLHSIKFIKKYREFIKTEFPHIPYPKNKNAFCRLSNIGNRLIKCHLLQMEFNTKDYCFIGEGTNEVVKPEYKNGKVYISKTQYFDNVPQSQWEQYIGGYQPLQKWLKDRKKTILSDNDIEHYKKIIAALKLTEELMAEIDEIVEF
ncbi:MAG: type ISP restriction/modification enzyme [Acutalibacteraceae bacterium]|nr:type ISP restriction/modification enzyme [Acutalibacteraceae bacterium]